jgi:hypothetical protein
MTIRNSIASVLGICALSFAGGLGRQHAQPSGAREGTIDFLVRQGHGAALAAASGSFDVRGIDNGEHVRVGIGNGTPRTLHVRLPPGSYAVAWNPALPVDAAGRARNELARDESAQEWPQIVVVTSDSASVVDVLVNAQGLRAEAPIQLASVGSRSAF